MDPGATDVDAGCVHDFRGNEHQDESMSLQNGERHNTKG